MRLNKRGMALLQVLIVAAILAGMAAMILRVSLSRTITVRQTRRTVSSQMLIENCMAEVNVLWAAKTPEAYARDLANCEMLPEQPEYLCEGLPVGVFNSNSSEEYGDNVAYTVTAHMEKNGADRCTITYTIDNNEGLL